MLSLVAGVRYHIDCAERIGVAGGEATNKIQASLDSRKVCSRVHAMHDMCPLCARCVQHKPLTTLPAQAMLDEGLEARA